MNFRNFKLDSFQEQAISELQKGNSVVVSAPTGTGKTLIADFLIDKAINERKKVIYTAPIKALSNQKYHDFTKQYGKEIGLLTGDVSINSGANILIMTTEIYRNMLLSRDKILSSISYIIFDEVHYINDYERGTVWEESIIFSPDYIRFLCLSATIPNAKEFASWISKIKKHKVEVVQSFHRVVPLKHYFFDLSLKEIDHKSVENAKYIKRFNKFSKKFDINLIDYLKNKNLTPALMFSFSRKEVEELALATSKRLDYSILSTKEQSKIVTLSRKILSGEANKLKSTNRLKQLLSQGIGYHHAGMLPKQKDVVEQLFTAGLIKFLFTTETFALGVNMPARVVVFNAIRKWDGRAFRYISSKEYFQMAGRAGRRGIDSEGYSIIPLNRSSKQDIDIVKHLVGSVPEAIMSQYKMTYNTAINLVHTFSKEQINQILIENFYYYTHKSNSNIKATFNSYCKKLKKLGYISPQNTLTDKGLFLSRLYTNELLVSELIFSNEFESLDPFDLTLLIATVIYEHRPSTRFYKKTTKPIHKHVVHLISKFKNNPIMSDLNLLDMKHLYPIIESWCYSGDLNEVLQMSNMLEGDLIRLFRQMLDLEQQILGSMQNLQMNKYVQRIEYAKKLINKSFVVFEE